MLTFADWPIILLGLCSILLLGGLSWRVWTEGDDETADCEILVRVPVPYSPAVAP